MMKLSILSTLLLFVSCTGSSVNNTSIPCINTLSITQSIDSVSNYRADSINFTNKKLYLKIRLLSSTFFDFQTEREFIFHILSSCMTCKLTELDSIRVLVVGDSIPNKNIDLRSNYNDITAQLSIRNSDNGLFKKAISKLLESNDYRISSLILISYFGDVYYNDNNGMHSDVDFFEFIMEYCNDVKQNNLNSSSYILLDRLEEKILLDTNLHTDIKTEILDFIHYLKSFRNTTSNIITLLDNFPPLTAVRILTDQNHITTNY